MKVLITGGCGFLGSNISVELIKNQDVELFILDNLYREGSEQNLSWLSEQGKFKFYNRDIRNHNDVEIIIKDIKPDTIFHLAGQVAMTTSIQNPRFDFETNALGSFNLLDSIRKYSNESAIIYSSTNKVYGDFEWLKFIEKDKRYTCPDFPNGFSEKLPLDFHSPYGCSKGSADQYMRDFYRIFGIKTVVFRHSSMYGGRQFSTYDQGWIGWFCSIAVKVRKGMLNEPFTISGNGKQVRDVLYSDDMVNLYISAMNNIEKIKGEAFNIGGGMENSFSLLELFDFLEKELEIKMVYKVLPWRESDQKIFVADLTEIKNRINWTPLISKENGIKKMLKWVEKNV